MSVRVFVADFQSLREVTLDLEGLTVLVGPSDRGKSALVRALEGALFNRPGTHFVREGARAAKVILEYGDELKARPAHRLVWEKGDGVNKFLIDGTAFDKPGKTTPPELRQLGFREETIGARLKEDGSGTDGGTAIRPQVAGQFDEIYLLTQSGTFIGEVITKLSRLGVLQQATRECALDKSSTSRLLKVRREDYEEAAATAEKLAGIPLLRERLNGLVTLDEEVDEVKTRHLRVRQYVEQRAQAQARLQVTLPAIPASRTETAAKWLTDYQQLLQVRVQLERRAKLAALPKKVTSFAASDSPAFKALLVVKERRDSLAQLVGARVMRQTAVDAVLHDVAFNEARYTQAVERVEDFKREMPICPLCAQPWAAAGEVHAV